MKKLTAMLVLGAALLGGQSAASAEGLNIVFTHHSSASNTFWQAVKKGYDDACAKIQANCNMIFTQTEGSIEQQVANMRAALAAKPDALLTSIVDNTALDDVIKEARDAGVIVIAVNVDDTEGAKGNARQAFIGQGFVPAGYSLGKAVSDAASVRTPSRPYRSGAFAHATSCGHLRDTRPTLRGDRPNDRGDLGVVIATRTDAHVLHNRGFGRIDEFVRLSGRVLGQAPQDPREVVHAAPEACGVGLVYGLSEGVLGIPVVFSEGPCKSCPSSLLSLSPQTRSAGGASFVCRGLGIPTVEGHQCAGRDFPDSRDQRELGVVHIPLPSCHSARGTIRATFYGGHPQHRGARLGRRVAGAPRDRRSQEGDVAGGPGSQ